MSGRFWNWYDRANAIVRTFTGPAQIGAGYDEAPEQRGSDHPCPLCGTCLSNHTIERSTNQITPTRIICPEPATLS